MFSKPSLAFFFSSIARAYDPALRETDRADMALAIAGASDLR